MAVDATGAPTSQGIPKYNTAADAPSGKGLNAIVDAIDALIAARVIKPSGIAISEAPVWDGSAFVRSSATKIGVASLGTGTPDATKVLRGDGAWNQIADAQIATAAAIAQSKLAFDAWQTYTPVWTSTGVAPAIGNGVVLGRYIQIGKWVFGYIKITFGTTSTFGTGTYNFSVPVVMSANILGGTTPIGSAFGNDAGVNAFPGLVVAGTNTVVNVYSTLAAGTVWTNTVPFAWGNTDIVNIQFAYEAA